MEKNIDPRVLAEYQRLSEEAQRRKKNITCKSICNLIVLVVLGVGIVMLFLKKSSYECGSCQGSSNCTTTIDDECFCTDNYGNTCDAGKIDPNLKKTIIWVIAVPGVLLGLQILCLCPWCNRCWNKYYDWTIRPCVDCICCY